MPVAPRDVTKQNPLKGVQRRKELKRKRKYNRMHKGPLEHQMEKIEQKSCYGIPKGCSREKRRWRHPKTGGVMSNKRIAGELLKLARELLAGDSAIKKMVSLIESYNGISTRDVDWREQMSSISMQAKNLRDEFMDDYSEQVVLFLKQSKISDPMMVFLGSLAINTSDSISNKYLGKSYPSLLDRVNKLLVGNKVREKFLIKQAYDKVFGRGVFEMAVKNNRRK